MRYHIFCGHTYYAAGGSNDHYRSCNDVVTAKAIAQSIYGTPMYQDDYETVDWVNVFDSKLCKTIFEIGQKYGEVIIDHDYMLPRELPECLRGN